MALALVPCDRVTRDACQQIGGYRLARQYAERSNSRYGTGLFPESAPLVEDIADFWCQYHLGKPLREWLATSS